MQATQLDQLPSTPMWIQYKAIKKEAIDSLLFYRMGDFYELFLNDATVAAGVLGITLTTRNKGEEAPIPMCGVPAHSASAYITKLLNAGYRVAICEQVEDPAKAKGIVARAITRRVSPGLAFDSDALEAGSNNYLLALHQLADAPHRGSYAVADSSTGAFEFALWQSPEQLRDDLALLRPREVLVCASAVDSPLFLELREKAGSDLFPCVSSVPDFHFSPTLGARELPAHFGTLNLEGFGLSADHPGLPPVGALLRTLKDSFQGSSLSHLRPPAERAREGFLAIDDNTLDHLDILPKPGQSAAESLFFHLNRTRTAMGARRLREVLCRPLNRKDAILFRQNAISELKHRSSTLHQIRQLLGDVRDLERLCSKIGTRTCTPRDLVTLRSTLEPIPTIRQLLTDQLTSTLLRSIGTELQDFQEIQSQLKLQLPADPPLGSREGNIFLPGWNTRLDELIQLTENGHSLIEQLEARERELTGIASLKVKFNRVFGFFIEISNSKLAAVPARYHRKQTTANGERFSTEELTAMEEKILSSREQRAALEESLFSALVAQLSEHIRAILASAAQLAELDTLCALAHAALELSYTEPEICEDNSLEIEDGRHPALENLIGRDLFIANSIHFSARESTFLITGPNMAGKSTFMRQVALITLLAHTGSLVPAARAKVGIVDRIATRIGASDRIGRGQSTFMVEMNEMAKILRLSSGKSLLIIDEIGRGTSTFDGLALAWAILEEIVGGLRCRALFATHYHELTALESRFSSLKNLCAAIEEKDGRIVFLHEMRKGKAPGSFGLEVARLAGLAPELIARAAEVLSSLEKGSSRTMKNQKAVLHSGTQGELFASHPPSIQHLIAMEQQLRSLSVDHCSPFQALETVKRWKENLPPPNQIC